MILGSPAMELNSHASPPDVMSLLNASSDSLSTTVSLLYYRVCLEPMHITSKCPFIPDNQKNRFLQLRENNEGSLPASTLVAMNYEIEKVVATDDTEVVSLNRRRKPEILSMRKEGRPIVLLTR